MVKKKVIAICFSDLHIDYPKKFNQNGQRTLSTLRVLSVIKRKCLRYQCPAIFGGDMFHRPEVIPNDLFNLITDYFKKLDKDPWIMFCIGGNHDLQKANSLDKPSPNWIQAFAKIYGFVAPVEGINGIGYVNNKEAFKIFGVPYLDQNRGLKQAIQSFELDKVLPNILLLHSTYPGAKETDGSENIGGVDNINLNMLSKFDLTLMGHVHKPQRLSKKVYMLGAPIQQRRTDRDCKMGYWKLYSDLSMEFKELKGFPKFIDVESEDQIKDDGNYYTLISKILVTDSIRTNVITKQTSRKGMVRQYMKTKGVKDKDKKQLLTRILESV